MFPLLIKDGLRLPYWVVNAGFLVLVWLRYDLQDTKHKEKVSERTLLSNLFPLNAKIVFVILSISGMLVLHCMECLILPPKRYPDLYPALFSLYSAGNLVVMYLIGNYYLFCESKSSKKEKST